MDAEHRHELKRNELAEALSHLKEWRKIDRSWLTTIGIIVVFVLGWVALRTWTWATEQSEYNNWARYQEIQRAPGPDGLINTQELRTAASGGFSSSITPLAKIELADVLCRNASVDSTNHDELLVEAQTTVKDALALVAEMKTPVLQAAALMTQARVFEALGDFDGAHAVYEKLQQPRFAGTPFTTPLGVGTSVEQPSIVEQRLANLDELREPVKLLAGLPPGAGGETTNLPNVPDLSALGNITDLDAETNEQAKPPTETTAPTETTEPTTATESTETTEPETTEPAAETPDDEAAPDASAEAPTESAENSDAQATDEERGADDPNAP